nr:DUF1516 family protein [Anaerobacillus sp. CMMVII]
MIGTGVGLLVLMQFPGTYIVKGLLALSLVYFMEMILVKTKKGTLKPIYWVFCISVLTVVLLIGYRVISF